MQMELGNDPLCDAAPSTRASPESQTYACSLCRPGRFMKRVRCCVSSGVRHVSRLVAPPPSAIVSSHIAESAPQKGTAHHRQKESGPPRRPMLVVPKHMLVSMIVEALRRLSHLFAPNPGILCVDAGLSSVPVSGAKSPQTWLSPGPGLTKHDRQRPRVVDSAPSLASVSPTIRSEAWPNWVGFGIKLARARLVVGVFLRTWPKCGHMFGRVVRLWPELSWGKLDVAWPDVCAPRQGVGGC